MTLELVKAIKKKLRKKSAETLTETLVSVLIISIVSVALASMIGTAARVNEIARDYDLRLDQAIGTLTTGTGASANVKIEIWTASKNATKIAEESFGSSDYNGGSVSVRGDSGLNLYGYTYTAASAKTSGTTGG